MTDTARSEVVDASSRFGKQAGPRPGRRLARAIRGIAAVRFLDVATAMGLWLSAVAMLAFDTADGQVSLWSAWASLVVGAAAVVAVMSWTRRKVSVTDRQRLDAIHRGLDVLTGRVHYPDV
jgi:hypothetical protein